MIKKSMLKSYRLPFNKNTHLTILYQEMKAESRISIFRIVITLILLGLAVSEAIFFKESVYAYSFPFFIALIFSIGFYLEIRYLLTHNNYKWIQYFYKYMVIFIDIFTFGYAIYHSFLSISDKSPFGDRTELVLVLSLTSFVIILLFIDIFRFSSLTSYYIGITGSFAVILFSSRYISGSFFNISSFFEDIMHSGAISLIILSALISGVVSRYFHSLVLKSRRQEQLERFMPSDVVRDILKGEKEIEIGGKRKKVTILFSDIRNFTSMSEKTEPEEVIDFLNSYFNDMIEVIFKYKGSLDKIIGDGIMAIYGITEGSENNEEMAVLSAIDMIKKLADFNSLREMQGKEKIDIGIGIHTGDVILGNVGSEKRMDFTAIGDTVNTASRLQDLTKKTDCRIIVSEAIVNALPEKITCNPLGNANLKGKKEPINIFGID